MGVGRTRAGGGRGCRGLAILLAGISLGCGVPAAAATPQAGETARNRVVVTRFFDLFYRQKKVRAAFETYVAPGYIQHNPIAADGRDNAIAVLEPFFAKNPGLRYEIRRIIVDGDLAAVHSLAHLVPGDRGSAVVDIVRLDHGKVVEHWDVLQPIPATSANAHPMF